MTVEEKIRSIIDKMSISYIYEDWQRANWKLDAAIVGGKISFPVCINLLPVYGTLSVKAGFVKDSPNCMIAFVDKAEMDFDGLKNQGIVDRMKNYAKVFVSKCQESGLFDPISDEVRYSVVYDKLDVNVTGVVLELKLKESQGVCPENIVL